MLLFVCIFIENIGRGEKKSSENEEKPSLNTNVKPNTWARGSHTPHNELTRSRPCGVTVHQTSDVQ